MRRPFPVSWSSKSSRTLILLRQLDGSGVGLPEQWEDFPDGMSQLVTEAVQAAAVDALWAQGKGAVWLACPDHPGTHPLQVQEAPQPLTWVCATTTRRVAVVGRVVS